MDLSKKEFLEFGNAALEFAANYMETVRYKAVLPDVEPGYLSKLIPGEAPQKSEKWQDVLNDVERCIIPGMTHWSSPNFHAFYPTGSSYPSIIGDILSDAFSCIGFSWIASPACTELEMVTMNWLGKMLGLPEQFLNCGDGPGGGVIQGSASEVTLVCLLVAKERTTRRIKRLHPDWDEGYIKSKLVAYTSDQSNSSVEKAGIIASVPMKLLPTDNACSLRGETLLEAINIDLANGMIPCYVVATLGTTATCAFDNLEELGPICKEYDLWLHVDAAYAGSAFICPEYRYLMSGVEYADSFNMNPHKWLLVNFDCSAMWVKDARPVLEAFSVDRIYLAHDRQDQAHVPDYRNWQISLGRRFRSLKLWFVIRLYGVEGLQQYIKHSIRQAQMFEKYVLSDARFELVCSSMSLVCFRLKGDNDLTKECHSRLTERKNIFTTIATYKDKHIIRFAVGNRFSTEQDIIYAWNEITTVTAEMLGTKDLSREDMNLISGKASENISARIELMVESEP